MVVWWFQDHWLTVRLPTQTFVWPVAAVFPEPPKPSLAVDMNTVLSGAAASLDKEACDRRAMQAYIGAAVSLNKPRELIQRSARFEQDCGDWDLLAMSRAEAHAQLSEWNAAREQYDRWVALAKDSAVAWTARGRFREQRDDADGAIADYRRALLLEPTFTDVPQWLAALLLRTERPCGAVPVLEQLLLNQPSLADDPRVTNMLSRARSHSSCGVFQGTGTAQVQLMGRDQMLDVDARIAGRPFAAVLDTGASFVTLPRAAADALQLDLKHSREVHVKVVGSVRIAQRVILERISVGKATARKVPAIVVDEVFPDSDTILLGMSFLTRFKLSFDPQERTVTLKGTGSP